MGLSKNKKTGLLILIALGLVAVFVGPGIMAYFSATQTSTENLFTAGTINLAVDNENPWMDNLNADLSDLKPGMNRVGTVTLTNVGTNPFDVWVRVQNVTTTAGTDTYPESLEPAATNIDSVIQYNVSVGGTPELPAGFTISDGAHHLAGKTAGVKDKYIYLGNIAAGDPMTVAQSFMMDVGTTNWAQGDTMSFKVQFYALQSEGDTQPPAVTPELEGHGR